MIKFFLILCFSSSFLHVIFICLMSSYSSLCGKILSYLFSTLSSSFYLEVLAVNSFWLRYSIFAKLYYVFGFYYLLIYHVYFLFIISYFSFFYFYLYFYSYTYFFYYFYLDLYFYLDFYFYFCYYFGFTFNFAVRWC